MINIEKEIEKDRKISDHLPVVIFGAGLVGEVLFKACTLQGIRVECFCENNISKTQQFFCNTPVIPVTELRKRFSDATVFISAADIQDVLVQLESLGFYHWYSASTLLRNFNTFDHQFSASPGFVEFAVTTCLLCHDSFLTPDKVFLRSVDIVITERCSLRCRDCSNLMQYYEDPKDFPVEEVFGSIDALCSLVDQVNEFRVIGGEPFMNGEIHRIIGKLAAEPKIRKIVIYTNGTILPKDFQIEALKNEKILFIITDYGPLSRNLHSLTDILSNHSIAFHVLKVSGWAQCSTIQKHNRSMERQKEVFRTCCAKNLITLIGGKLFRCPFAGNAFNLRAIPPFSSDYIDIFEAISFGTDSAKKIIRDFLLKVDFLASCDYCNGRPFGAEDCVPAIQAQKPIPYKKFSESE